MYDLRRFSSLGAFRNEWLNAKHHFSFSSYYDPKRMGWGPLRVWNDDTVASHSGFPPHGHRDMEIITYVRQGVVSHGDNQGNKGATAAGEVQVMSAGTGIMHSEMNLGDDDATLFQIWIEPARMGLKPRWETRSFPGADAGGAKFVPLASGQGFAGALEIAQDATLYAAHLKAGETLDHDLGLKRLGYLVPTVGSVEIGGIEVGARDGLAIKDVDRLAIKALADTTLVFADLPQ